MRHSERRRFSAGARNLSLPGTRPPRTHLPLAELEPFASALLSILLALFAARIAADQALSLQLLAQFRVELHQCAGYAQLHRVGLTAHAAAQNTRNDVERSCRI